MVEARPTLPAPIASRARLTAWLKSFRRRAPKTICRA